MKGLDEDNEEKVAAADSQQFKWTSKNTDFNDLEAIVYGSYNKRYKDLVSYFLKLGFKHSEFLVFLFGEVINLESAMEEGF